MHLIFFKRVDVRLSVLTKRGGHNWKLLEVMGVLIILTAVIVSWVYTYAQTHERVSIKSVQFFIYQLSIKVFVCMDVHV